MNSSKRFLAFLLSWGSHVSLATVSTELKGRTTCPLEIFFTDSPFKDCLARIFSYLFAVGYRCLYPRFTLILSTQYVLTLRDIYPPFVSLVTVFSFPTRFISSFFFENRTVALFTSFPAWDAFPRGMLPWPGAAAFDFLPLVNPFFLGDRKTALKAPL